MATIVALYLANLLVGAFVLVSLRWLDRQHSVLTDGRRRPVTSQPLLLNCKAVWGTAMIIGLLAIVYIPLLW